MRSPLPVLLLTLLCGCGLALDPVAGPAAAETGPAPIPEVMMGALQEDLELNAVQAAAILGNLAQETGNFTLLRQINGSAIGYSQWMGPRKREFLSFAEENGGAFSHEANYGFLVEELLTQYEGTLERIRSTDRVDEATRIFMTEFLRPSPKHANLSGRVRYAELFLSEEFSGAGCVGTEPVDGGRVPPCPDVTQTSVEAAAGPDTPVRITEAEVPSPETASESYPAVASSQIRIASDDRPARSGHGM